MRVLFSYQAGLASGRSLGRDWRRRPGRPRARWTDQLRKDTGSVAANSGDRQTDRPSYGAMVERCDGPSWLRDDDDDNDYFPTSVNHAATLAWFYATRPSLSLE